MLRPPPRAACCCRVAAVRTARPRRRRVSVLASGERCVATPPAEIGLLLTARLSRHADAPPAVAIAERTRWTLGARAPTSASEELKPDLVTTVRERMHVASGSAPRADALLVAPQYLSETCMSKMELNTLAMRAARASNARHASDTGSSEVQGVCCAKACRETTRLSFRPLRRLTLRSPQCRSSPSAFRT